LLEIRILQEGVGGSPVETIMGQPFAKFFRGNGWRAMAGFRHKFK
jgi:hypothetical protein